MNTKPVVATNLIKKFDDFVAVNDVSFTIEPGEFFGLLGPNGAGKSSTMRMIGATSPVTGGDLSVFDLDPATHGKQIRARLGVIPQDNHLEELLTAKQNLIIYGRYFNMSRADANAKADEVLDFVQLGERAESAVESLSGGMKRRLAIARGLMNTPDMVLLDEPTTGLDPQARHLLWDRLYDLKSRGVTLLLTTHFMDEAEQLCDRLVVINEGKVIAEGSPVELIKKHTSREVLEVRFRPDSREADRGAVADLGDHHAELRDRVLIYADRGDELLSEINRRDIHPESALVRRSSLEDVFMILTGRTLDE